MRKYRINWEGTQFVYHSLALVNREICLQLIDLGHDLFITPYEQDTFDHRTDARFRKIAQRIIRMDESYPQVDFHIQHRWPPRLDPPKTGRWIVMQPWEFGSMPLSWMPIFSDRVDELWVPSSYVKGVFADGGVPQDKICIIPNGVNPAKFNPDVQPMVLGTHKPFRFLFVGGALYRKGIDLLLKAYIQAFTAADDVCLVVKSFGRDTFYRDQSLGFIIKRMSQRKDLPEILFLDGAIPEDSMPSLYKACDVLVHPYRGEGFALPVLESMACGTPAVVTGGGACLDYCNSKNSLLLKAFVRKHGKNKVGNLDTVDETWFFEPDLEDLKEKMLWTHRHQEELKTMGAQSSMDILPQWTWHRSAQRINERLHALH